MKFLRLALAGLCFGIVLVGQAGTSRPTALLDTLIFGNTISEKNHQLESIQSETVSGAFNQSARRLLPTDGKSWEGGHLDFNMQIDPQRPNYLTVRLWGDEVNHDYLLLFCEGKQVGYRHLGDIDVLALPDEEPRYNGRFYYVTTPLPVSLTKGKTKLHLEVRSTGPIWGYGRTFEQYQKPMTEPSRNIYRLYTHTDGCFVPPKDELQGQPPKDIVRPAPGEEVLNQVKERVNREISGMLNSKRPLNQMQVLFLARAYSVKWTMAYQQKKVMEQVLAGVDDRYWAWKKDAPAVWRDRATWNPDWFGLGPAGEAVWRLAGPLQSLLDVKLDGDKTRRAAWTEMFQASRDWLRTHRRLFTNQTMFVDTNIYRSHLALTVIDSANDWSEEQAKRYLYESVGILPWTGSDTPTGPQENMGDAYYELTEIGLSKELGYVGSYGEILGQMVDLYMLTRKPGLEGDAKIKAQIEKLQRARLYFRYPMTDEKGYRAMRLETGVGWRDTHFPGAVTYAQRSGLDETGIYAAAATLEPSAVGAVQQMFADNQFFASVADQLKDRRLRALYGLLTVPDDYAKIKAQPATGKRLPMSWDQPDVAYADEGDGVVAIKHGNEILYVSLYWRASFGINSLARTHYLTPRYQQVAVVHTDVQSESSGQVYKRKNWVNFGFGNGGMHYPGKLQSAHTGEELPIAKLPAGVQFKPGDTNPYAGRAEFYELRYGSYYIAMNTTKGKTFTAKNQPHVKHVTDLVSGKPVDLSLPLQIAPGTTVVLYLGR